MNKKFFTLTVLSTIVATNLFSANIEEISFYNEVKKYKKEVLTKDKRYVSALVALDDLKNNDKAILLDFRDQNEKNAAKIPNAFEVRAHHFTKDLDDVIKTKNLKELETIYMVCRTASRATYQTMAWDNLVKEIKKTKPDFNVEMKIISLVDYAKSCNPLFSFDDNVKGSYLHAKNVNLKLSSDGKYYMNTCKNVEFFD